MLHLRCTADVLKSLVDATYTLVDEAKLNISPDGIGLKAVDPAHVAMVELTLSKDAFDEFKADELELGLDMDKFRDVLRLAGTDDTVDLDYDQDKHRLTVRIGQLKREMSLVDTSSMPDPKVPELDLPGHIVLDVAQLQKGVKASEAVSDHVALLADADGFEVRAEGDTDTVDLKLPADMLAELEVDEDVRSLFSLDYFSNMIKAAKGSGDVRLELGTDYPVKMHFSIADGNGQVTYLLAPRIES